MYISVKALAMQEGCSVSTVWSNIRKMKMSGMYPNATKESGGLKIDPDEYNNFLCRQRRLKINKRKDSGVGAPESVPRKES